MKNRKMTLGWMALLAVTVHFAFTGYNGEEKPEDKHKGNKEIKKQEDNWEILFDGTDLDKWRKKNSNEAPSGWVINPTDKTLVLGEKGSGDIITKEKYGDFELQFEFQLTPEANSGIKYFVNEITNKATGNTYVNGPEYQIIDDYNHPEVKDKKDEKSAMASLYLFYPAENKKLNPAGEWNEGKITAKGKNVEHWLNGIKVLQYERGNKDYLDRKAETKFKDDEDYGEHKNGHILITDHQDKVYFRNMKIRKL